MIIIDSNSCLPENAASYNCVGAEGQKRVFCLDITCLQAVTGPSDLIDPQNEKSNVGHTLTI